MFFDYFSLAVKNLRKRGIRSWLTMLGIFLGIAAVVSLISLGQGLQKAITGQFGTLDPDKLIIQNIGAGFGPPGSTTIRKLTSEDLKIIDETQGVEFTIKRLIRVARADFNDAARFESLVSFPEDEEGLKVVYDFLNADTELGRALETTDSGSILLGNNFIEEGRFGKEINVGAKLKIQGENFEVIGILEKTGSFLIDSSIFMLEEDMKKILDIGDEIDLIVAQVEEQDRIEETADEIARRLRKDRNQKIGEEDFSVQTPLQSIQSINTILNVVNLVVAGIAAISLLVGGIGIANTMFTSVLERRKEIGVMKSIGAQNKDVLMIFLIESGLLGLIGGIIGAIIGLGLAYAVSSAAGSFLGGISLQVEISSPLILASLAFSLVVGIVSGMIPALRASKLNPVEALRS